MHTFSDEVHTKIVQAIEKFFKQGINSDVVLIYTIKGKEVVDAQILTVDTGYLYFHAGGYYPNGLNSFSKIEGESARHGYVIFETKRVLDVIGRIGEDLENIKSDLLFKIQRS